MLLTTKSGRAVEMPTDEENALIEAGIASDVDTYELSAAEFSQLKHIGRPSAALLIQQKRVSPTHQRHQHIPNKINFLLRRGKGLYKFEFILPVESIALWLRLQ